MRAEPGAETHQPPRLRAACQQLRTGGTTLYVTRDPQAETVVEDDPAAATLEAEPDGTAVLPIETLPAPRSRPGDPCSRGVRERDVGCGRLGRSPAVERHPVRHGVSTVEWPVAGIRESTTDLGDEALLLLPVRRRGCAKRMAQERPNPAATPQPNPGFRKASRNLVVGFARFTWTGHVPVLASRVDDQDQSSHLVHFEPSQDHLVAEWHRGV